MDLQRPFSVGTRAHSSPHSRLRSSFSDGLDTTAVGKYGNSAGGTRSPSAAASATPASAFDIAAASASLPASNCPESDRRISEDAYVAQARRSVLSHNAAQAETKVVAVGAATTAEEETTLVPQTATEAVVTGPNTTIEGQDRIAIAGNEGAARTPPTQRDGVPTTTTAASCCGGTAEAVECLGVMHASKGLGGPLPQEQEEQTEGKFDFDEVSDVGNDSVAGHLPPFPSDVITVSPPFSHESSFVRTGASRSKHEETATVSLKPNQSAAFTSSPKRAVDAAASIINQSPDEVVPGPRGAAVAELPAAATAATAQPVFPTSPQADARAQLLLKQQQHLRQPVSWQQQQLQVLKEQQQQQQRQLPILQRVGRGWLQLQRSLEPLAKQRTRSEYFTAANDVPVRRVLSPPAVLLCKNSSAESRNFLSSTTAAVSSFPDAAAAEPAELQQRGSQQQQQQTAVYSNPTSPLLLWKQQQFQHLQQGQSPSRDEENRKHSRLSSLSRIANLNEVTNSDASGYRTSAREVASTLEEIDDAVVPTALSEPLEAAVATAAESAIEDEVTHSVPASQPLKEKLRSPASFGLATSPLKSVDDFAPVEMVAEAEAAVLSTKPATAAISAARERVDCMYSPPFPAQVQEEANRATKGVRSTVNQVVSVKEAAATAEASAAGALQLSDFSSSNSSNPRPPPQPNSALHSKTLRTSKFREYPADTLSEKKSQKQVRQGASTQDLPVVVSKRGHIRIQQEQQQQQQDLPRQQQRARQSSTEVEAEQQKQQCKNDSLLTFSSTSGGLTSSQFFQPGGVCPPQQAPAALSLASSQEEAKRAADFVAQGSNGAFAMHKAAVETPPAAGVVTAGLSAIALRSAVGIENTAVLWCRRYVAAAGASSTSSRLKEERRVLSAAAEQQLLLPLFVEMVLAFNRTALVVSGSKFAVSRFHATVAGGGAAADCRGGGAVEEPKDAELFKVAQQQQQQPKTQQQVQFEKQKELSLLERQQQTFMEGQHKLFLERQHQKQHLHHQVYVEGQQEEQVGNGHPLWFFQRHQQKQWQELNLKRLVKEALEVATAAMRTAVSGPAAAAARLAAATAAAMKENQQWQAASPTTVNAWQLPSESAWSPERGDAPIVKEEDAAAAVAETTTTLGKAAEEISYMKDSVQPSRKRVMKHLQKGMLCLLLLLPAEVATAGFEAAAARERSEKKGKPLLEENIEKAAIPYLLFPESLTLQQRLHSVVVLYTLMLVCVRQAAATIGAIAQKAAAPIQEQQQQQRLLERGGLLLQKCVDCGLSVFTKQNILGQQSPLLESAKVKQQQKRPEPDETNALRLWLLLLLRDALLPAVLLQQKQQSYQAPRTSSCSSDSDTPVGSSNNSSSRRTGEVESCSTQKRNRKKAKKDLPLLLLSQVLPAWLDDDSLDDEQQQLLVDVVRAAASAAAGHPVKSQQKKQQQHQQQSMCEWTAEAGPLYHSNNGEPANWTRVYIAVVAAVFSRVLQKQGYAAPSLSILLFALENQQQQQELQQKQPFQQQPLPQQPLLQSPLQQQGVPFQHQQSGLLRVVVRRLLNSSSSAQLVLDLWTAIYLFVLRLFFASSQLTERQKQQQQPTVEEAPVKQPPPAPELELSQLKAGELQVESQEEKPPQLEMKFPGSASSEDYLSRMSPLLSTVNQSDVVKAVPGGDSGSKSRLHPDLIAPRASKAKERLHHCASFSSSSSSSLSCVSQPILEKEDQLSLKQFPSFPSPDSCEFLPVVISSPRRRPSSEFPAAAVLPNSTPNNLLPERTRLEDNKDTASASCWWTTAASTTFSSASASPNQKNKAPIVQAVHDPKAPVVATAEAPLPPAAFTAPCVSQLNEAFIGTASTTTTNTTTPATTTTTCSVKASSTAATFSPPPAAPATSSSALLLYEQQCVLALLAAFLAALPNWQPLTLFSTPAPIPTSADRRADPTTNTFTPFSSTNSTTTIATLLFDSRRRVVVAPTTRKNSHTSTSTTIPTTATTIPERRGAASTTGSRNSRTRKNSTLTTPPTTTTITSSSSSSSSPRTSTRRTAAPTTHNKNRKNAFPTLTPTNTSIPRTLDRMTEPTPTTTTTTSPTTILRSADKRKRAEPATTPTTITTTTTTTMNTTSTSLSSAVSGSAAVPATTRTAGAAQALMTEAPHCQWWPDYSLGVLVGPHFLQNRSFSRSSSSCQSVGVSLKSRKNRRKNKKNKSSIRSEDCNFSSEANASVSLSWVERAGDALLTSLLHGESSNNDDIEQNQNKNLSVCQLDSHFQVNEHNNNTYQDEIDTDDTLMLLQQQRLQLLKLCICVAAAPVAALHIYAAADCASLNSVEVAEKTTAWTQQQCFSTTNTKKKEEEVKFAAATTTAAENNDWKNCLSVGCVAIVLLRRLLLEMLQLQQLLFSFGDDDNGTATTTTTTVAASLKQILPPFLLQCSLAAKKSRQLLQQQFTHFFSTFRGPTPTNTKKKMEKKQQQQQKETETAFVFFCAAANDLAWQINQLLSQSPQPQIKEKTTQLQTVSSSPKPRPLKHNSNTTNCRTTSEKAPAAAVVGKWGDPAALILKSHQEEELPRASTVFFSDKSRVCIPSLSPLCAKGLSSSNEEKPHFAGAAAQNAGNILEKKQQSKTLTDDTNTNSSNIAGQTEAEKLAFKTAAAAVELERRLRRKTLALQRLRARRQRLEASSAQAATAVTASSSPPIAAASVNDGSTRHNSTTNEKKGVAVQLVESLWGLRMQQLEKRLSNLSSSTAGGNKKDRKGGKRSCSSRTFASNYHNKRDYNPTAILLDSNSSYNSPVNHNREIALIGESNFSKKYAGGGWGAAAGGCSDSGGTSLLQQQLRQKVRPDSQWQQNSRNTQSPNSKNSRSRSSQQLNKSCIYSRKVNLPFFRSNSSGTDKKKKKKKMKKLAVNATEKKLRESAAVPVGTAAEALWSTAVALADKIHTSNSSRSNSSKSVESSSSSGNNSDSSSSSDCDSGTTTRKKRAKQKLRSLLQPQNLQLLLQLLQSRLELKESKKKRQRGKRQQQNSNLERGRNNNNSSGMPTTCSSSGFRSSDTSSADVAHSILDQQHHLQQQKCKNQAVLDTSCQKISTALSAVVPALPVQQQQQMQLFFALKKEGAIQGAPKAGAGVDSSNCSNTATPMMVATPTEAANPFDQARSTQQQQQQQHAVLLNGSSVGIFSAGAAADQQELSAAPKKPQLIRMTRCHSLIPPAAAAVENVALAQQQQAISSNGLLWRDATAGLPVMQTPAVLPDAIAAADCQIDQQQKQQQQHGQHQQQQLCMLTSSLQTPNCLLSPVELGISAGNMPAAAAACNPPPELLGGVLQQQQLAGFQHQQKSVSCPFAVPTTNNALLLTEQHQLAQQQHNAWQLQQLPLEQLQQPAAASPSSSSWDLPLPYDLEESVELNLYFSMISRNHNNNNGNQQRARRARPLYPTGLRNLGNTCYLNSLLQSLFLSDAFVCNLLRFEWKTSRNRGHYGAQRRSSSTNVVSTPSTLLLDYNCPAPSGPPTEGRSSSVSPQRDEVAIPNPALLREMQLLFVELVLTSARFDGAAIDENRSWKTALSPKRLLETLPAEYQQQQQQDVSEAARAIFEGLGGQEAALIRLVFGGVTAQVVRCDVCKRESRREDVVHDFDFPVPSQAYVDEQRKLRRLQKKRRQQQSCASMDSAAVCGLEDLVGDCGESGDDDYANSAAAPLPAGVYDRSSTSGTREWTDPSLQEFFDAYMKKERLVGDNAYACERCGKRQPALKWQEIRSPPAHLIVILNRYAWSFTSNDKKKVPTHVHINRFLSVCSFHYTLYAAIIHSGTTANSGHYYCIGARSESTQQRLLLQQQLHQQQLYGDAGFAAAAAASSPCRWYRFDDSVVTEVDGKTINRISADTSHDDAPYIIFYRCIEAPFTSTCLVHRRMLRFAQRRLRAAEEEALEEESY